MTFGTAPRLFVKIVKNFYKRPLSPIANPLGTSTPTYQQQQQPQNNYPNQNQNLYPNQNQNLYPNQNQNQLYSGSMYNNSNIYNQVSGLYSGAQQQYYGPPISIQFPQDELYLINDAILLDKYELSNGIIYLMNSYPRYYENSLYQILRSNTIAGLSQSLK